jgi:CheY-like chemotaxis protein
MTSLKTAPEDSWNDTSANKQQHPASPANTDSAKDEDVLRPSNAVALPMIEGLKVLVIGDTPRRREKIVKKMESYGVIARAATADEDGYRTALRFCPDVALSEMARPGDPGWWLLKRFHRHPVLKWTPALLMKWWEEKNGHETILINSVFERLIESLTPVRILKERIAAGRKLNDAIEITGVATVVNVLSDALLTGNLSINDSWNVFSMDFSLGKIISCNRSGVDGSEDAGQTAFFQMMLADSGHWTFRTHDSAPRPHNINLSAARLIAQANAGLTAMLGPDVNAGDSGFIRRLKINPVLFHDVATTFNGLARDVLEGIAAAVSKAELETIIGESTDYAGLERAIITLLRSGAVYLTDMPMQDLSEKELKASRCTAFLLGWIASDHRMGKNSTITSDSPDIRKKTKTGYYSFKGDHDNRIDLNPDNLSLNPPPGPDAKSSKEQSAEITDQSATVDLSSSDSWRQATTGDTTESDMQTKQASHTLNSAISTKPADSLAPGPIHTGRINFQMAAAILIAILLGAMLIGGLVMIAKQNPGPSSEPASLIE